MKRGMFSSIQIVDRYRYLYVRTDVYIRLYFYYIFYANMTIIIMIRLIKMKSELNIYNNLIVVVAFPRLAFIQLNHLFLNPDLYELDENEFPGKS
jgi:hypothetical protein